MPNTVERVVTKIVADQFPAMQDIFVFREPTKLTESSASAATMGNTDARAVQDQPGKAYFMFGISKWGSSDIVAG